MLPRLNETASLAVLAWALWGCESQPAPPAPGATPTSSGAAVGSATPTAPATPLEITHGLAVGEVTASTAVVWARGSRAGTLHVALGDHAKPAGSIEIAAERDFTGRIALEKLTPGATHRIRAWLTDHAEPGAMPDDAAAATFRTAPAADAKAPVRFAWSGDLGGQNFCRDKDDGYVVLKHASKAAPHFFIGLGDMIYAGDTCTAVGRYGNFQAPARFGPSTMLADYWAHYRYNRRDPGLQALSSTAGYYAVIDDHEIVNDAGPKHDTRDQPPYDPATHLLPIGVQAFFDYHPMVGHPDDQRRLHRAVRWGQHVELFLLDLRQHRDDNAAEDEGEPMKSMLGSGQRDWLLSSLRASDATWKVVVSSVPIAIPTSVGGTPDGWAARDGKAGFERELRTVFEAMRAQGIKKTVWLTTDVHFATGFEHRPFGDDSLTVYEFAVGPISAGIFPNSELSETFHPKRLFMHAPKTPEAVTGYDEAKKWVNYGLVDVDAEGKLTVQVKNGLDEEVFAKSFDP